MGKVSGRSKRYPQELLTDVLWAFSRPRFRLLARFEAGSHLQAQSNWAAGRMAL
ncbi:MAG: hypothetical protein L0241_03830 [Planctomycetia bacterium]|nr:hypothetical protein [Planctomycetia bacterium]